MTAKTIIKKAAFAIPVLLLLSVFIFRYAPAIMVGLISVPTLLLILAIVIIFVYYFIKILKTIE